VVFFVFFILLSLKTSTKFNNSNLGVCKITDKSSRVIGQCDLAVVVDIALAAAQDVVDTGRRLVPGIVLIKANESNVNKAGRMYL